MKKILLLVFFLFCLLSLNGCERAAEKQLDINSINYYTDIPEITAEEIAAIEALKSSRESFSYGALIGTEMFVQPDGTYEGFTYRYCLLLSGLFGIEFKPEMFYNWDDLKARYDDKELDFIGELCPTPERMEIYQMTNTIAEHALRIYTVDSSPEIEEEADITGLRIGFLANTITASYVRAAYPYEFELFEVGSYEEAVSMLLSGTIDAFVEDADSDAFFLDYEQIQSKKLFPLVYTPISMSTANEELAPVIAAIDKYLAAGGVDTLLDMYGEGELAYAKYKFDRFLSEEERNYIEAARITPVKLALENDNYPICFYNLSEQMFQGIAVDVLEEIKLITGIEFKTVTSASTRWVEMLELLRTGDAAMISQLLQTEDRREGFLWADKPYSTAKYALISKIDYPDISNHQVLASTVGTLRDTAFESVFFEWFPDHKRTKQYDSQADIVEALESGEIDLMMASEYMLLSQNSYYENTGLKINVLFSTPVESYYGFNKNEEILCSIINKVQSYVDTEAIERKWVNRTFDYQKKAATERMHYFMAFSAALLFVLILTIVLFVNNTKLSKNLAELVAERTYELERQTATLMTVYESIPDIVFSTDMDLRYTSCNPSFERFIGRPESEIIGKTAYDIYTDEKVAAGFTEANRDVIKSKRPKIMEEELVYPDGRREIVETIKTPLLQNGSIAGILSVARNITERRSADERAKLMLEATPLCCCLFDSDFNLFDCNNEAMRLFGMKDKNEFRESFYSLTPKFQPNGRKSTDMAMELLKEAFEAGRVVFEWIHKTPDGTLIPAEITLVRVIYGSEYAVAGYIRDLREYKKMIQDIEHKGNLLQTANTVASILLGSGIEEFENNLWNCMGMMAASVSADRAYIWKNHIKDGRLHCSQIYEWSEGAEPQQGKEITIDTPYDDVAPGWEEELSNGRCVKGIVREMTQELQDALSPQGILSILIVPVFLRGNFWGFMGFDDCRNERSFTNDEEVVMRSGSLLIANALLRNEMTLDIRAAVDAAQAASRAKSNFLSNMSHEIRTPLNAITGMTNIGKSASNLERKNYALEKIEDASNHLLGVINDILDMSKIEASKFELSDIEFDFEKMLQKAVNVINFRVHEKKQHFAVFIDEHIPRYLIGDSQRLTQVIANLLSNAVKFTPEKASIKLDAHLKSEEDGVCVVQIDVTDEGIGIETEKHMKLFESFEQADNDISRKYGGTGLGLSISKHIVELMGGSIWVDSELGKGSKFSFTVKLRRGSEQYALTPAASWGNITVLVVDDESETREYFTQITQRIGISCDAVEGGTEALRMIDGGTPYNIIFVDWDMPGMNGIELSRAIKTRETGKAVIIMISSYEWSMISEEAKKAGVDRFLAKPLFPSSVVDCINECLGRQSIASSDSGTGEAVSFRGYTMLLAEDIEINREIVQNLFEETEIEIDCAENGAEALEMFKNAPTRYDLILMDIQMPEMDGLEATRRIRSLGFKEAEEIPIIAMTANVFREDIEQCKAAGMDDHLGKPLDFDEALNKMKRWLIPRR